MPSMSLHGPRQIDCSLAWRIWAPRSKDVQLVLFRGDRSQIVEMSRLQDGWFTASHPHCEEDLRYAFRLDGKQLRPDPASRWQPEGLHFPSALFFPEKFEWTDTSWTGLKRSELVFYELHVGTFTAAGTFGAIIPRLPQLRELGITALVLMPVTQFPGTRDWGYNAVHPFAVQNSYGGPVGLQALVDACHQHGLAVFLDVVYNYLGPEGNYLSEFGPYEHPTPLGVALNFDSRKCCAVRSFVLENVRYWLRDFHIDGLRLDAADSIFDQSETHILQEIRQVAEEVGISQHRVTHVIAEWDLGDVRFVDPRDQHAEGVAIHWSDDLHHCVHALLTNERQGCYSDFGDPEQLVAVLNHNVLDDDCKSLHEIQVNTQSAGQFPGSHFVASIQNHGHIGNRVKGDRIGNLLAPGQQRLAAALLILSPFLPHLFMGEEYGEQNPFPYFSSFHERSLANVVRHLRRCDCGSVEWPSAEADSQSKRMFRSARLRWEWPVGSWQSGLREWYRRLLHARRELSQFRDTVQRKACWYDRTGQNANSPDGNSERGSLRSPTSGPAEQLEGVLELIRGDCADATEPPILAYFNFSKRSQSLTGTFVARSIRPDWQPILSSEWPDFGGEHESTDRPGRTEHEWQLLPFEVLVLSAPVHQEW